MNAEAGRPAKAQPDNANRLRTAFVFAGGGSLRAVQAGMLPALVAPGVTPDLVVGSSVGAMNAAFYAGTPTSEGVEKLIAIWRSLRRQDVFPITLRTFMGFHQAARLSHHRRRGAAAGRYACALSQSGGG